LSIKESHCLCERKGRREEREQPTIKEDGYAGVEFAEEEFDERINFVLHKMLLASNDEGKCKNLFKTHCSGKNKRNLIVHSGSKKNLLSQKLVDYFKLSR
jgi:hypothetical protein